MSRIDTAAGMVAATPMLVLLVLLLVVAATARWSYRCCQARDRPCRPGWWAVVSVAAGIVFLVLALATRRDGVLVQFDHALASALSLSISPPSLWLLSWITHLGDRTLLTILAVAMTAALLWRRRWTLACLCAVVTGVGGLLTTGMKHTFQRARPEHLHGYVYEMGWSFPSGHASAAMAVYGIACFLALRILPARWHEIGLVGAATLICAIGASRVFLQVHYFSDVMAGFALSLAWMSLCLAVMGWVRLRRRH